MTQLFLTLTERSLAAGWLILVILTLRPLLRRAPRRAVLALWTLAAVRLCLPVTLTSSLSLIPRAAISLPQAALSGVSSAAPMTEHAAAAVSSGQAPLSADASTQSVLPVLARVWAIGAALLLLYALAGWLRTRRRLREAVCLGGNVWACDHLDTAFVSGILRPRIYLPSGLDAETARFVLAHERAHLRHGDPQWKLLGYALLAVYWFHPLIWAAYLLFCRDLELACDEHVVRTLDLTGRKAYSRALLSCSAAHCAALARPLAFGELGVKTRVKAALRYKKPSFRRSAAAALVCAAVAVCFLTDPKTAAPIADISGANAELASLLNTVADGSAGDAVSARSCIYAHPEEYRALLAHGDETLRYVFRQFLAGEEDGLRGAVMKQLMAELTEEEMFRLDTADAQIYFDHWRADNERYYAAFGEAYMRRERPKGWLLLETMAECGIPACDALPTAQLLERCALRTSPDGSVLETALPLDVGAQVTLLFSAELSSGTQLWYQVRYGGPQGEVIGWLPAASLDVPAAAAL